MWKKAFSLTSDKRLDVRGGQKNEVNMDGVWDGCFARWKDRKEDNKWQLCSSLMRLHVKFIEWILMEKWRE